MDGFQFLLKILIKRQLFSENIRLISKYPESDEEGDVSGIFKFIGIGMNKVNVEQ
jgi:hypothetical protein